MALAAGIGLLLSLPAAAMEFKVKPGDSGNILVTVGPSQAGDARRFLSALAAAKPVREVWMNSPGGDLIAGLELGRAFRAHHVAVRVPAGAVCASACTYSFLGGAVRRVDPEGQFRVHMFTAVEGYVEQAVPLVKKALSVEPAKREAALRYLLAALILKYEKESADLQRELADYVLNMGVSTRLLYPNTQTWAKNIETMQAGIEDLQRLSQKDMRDWGVINVAD